jgi:hypothetical protein
VSQPRFEPDTRHNRNSYSVIRPLCRAAVTGHAFIDKWIRKAKTERNEERKKKGKEGKQEANKQANKQTNK